MKRKIRLLGVALSGFSHGNQRLDLLEAERRSKVEKLTRAADQLRDRFGLRFCEVWRLVTFRWTEARSR